MKELVYVYWEDCAKCHQLKPHVEKWCNAKGYKFVPMQYADSWLEISSIPTAIVNDWGDERMLDFEGIVDLISKW